MEEGRELFSDLCSKIVEMQKHPETGRKLEEMMRDRFRNKSSTDYTNNKHGDANITSSSSTNCSGPKKKKKRNVYIDPAITASMNESLSIGELISDQIRPDPSIRPIHKKQLTRPRTFLKNGTPRFRCFKMRAIRDRDDSTPKCIDGRTVCAALWFLMLILFSSSPSIANDIIGTKKRRYEPPNECGLYLAPSSIPGAGLGMYSGSKKYEAYELVSDSDLMIPTWDLDYHNGNDVYHFLWDEYTWSSSK
eukprot:jgi/Psemu1/56654/gm1.56654_g